MQKLLHISPQATVMVIGGNGSFIIHILHGLLQIWFLITPSQLQLAIEFAKPKAKIVGVGPYYLSFVRQRAWSLEAPESSQV